MQCDSRCQADRVRFRGCTCGAEETRRIVEETCEAFAKDLAQIVARPRISDEDMNRPRFFPSRISAPNGIANAKRIRARLSR